MNKADFRLTGSQPKLEINRPAQTSIWKRPGTTNLLFVILLGLALFVGHTSTRPTEIPYSTFLAYVDSNLVDTVVITEKAITGTLHHPSDGVERADRFTTTPLPDTELAETLEQHGVTFAVRVNSDWLSKLLWFWILPIGLMVLFWTWSSRRMSAARGILNVGNNRIHIHPETENKITFDDVAGAQEAKEELWESVVFLKDPTRIQRLGGQMPKGILLVGSPGTGKTLLARAVSGEAGVPFFSISGSEFIEMFVGVGASRVRDLFDQARQRAPCIIFIDELDAIGRTRGGPVVMGGHDEREQTLNQLLTEMDGFDPSTGVVVMAATNRPEVLDKALLRAGRFDRQIVVDNPDMEERIAILELHARSLTLADDVDLRVVAQRTPGFVGADLANIANEAAIGAVRRNHNAVSMEDFELAIDRVTAGPEKKHRALSPDEKHRVAFHESGHTMVAITVPTAEPVHKVSIIPRGVAALGYTMQLPVKEKFLSTKTELEDQLAILLGGRVAEEIVFGDISSGASNDLERASEIARGMVCQLGMSETLGPLTYGRRQQAQYLGIEYGEDRNYSEETARLIDAEVRQLVEEAHERAHTILTDRRSHLNVLAVALEQREVLNGDEIAEVISGVAAGTPSAT